MDCTLITGILSLTILIPALKITNKMLLDNQDKGRWMGSYSLQFQHIINTILIVKLFKTTILKNTFSFFLKVSYQHLFKSSNRPELTKLYRGFSNFLPSV